MQIRDVTVSTQDGLAQISAYCGEFNLWYRFPEHVLLTPRGDAFVAANLIPAMSLGEDIELDEGIEVSPKLLKNLETVQDIFLLWGDYFGKKFSRIKITGGKSTQATSGNPASVSFFSGGVDGTHTFLKHRENLDYLLFAKGIDMQLSNEENYRYALEKNSAYALKQGKTLFPFETNVRYLGHKYGLSWNICFGGGLSSIALAGSFAQCFIASGLSYKDLYPHGSSFMSDYLWSNEFTKIIHDGAEASRFDKLRTIASDPEALAILRVCWHDRGYNCGECEKCLRTMASIRALKVNVPTFPECTDKLLRNRISKLKIYDEYVVAYWVENLHAAMEAGDAELARAMKKVIKGWGRRKLAHLIDDEFLGGALTRVKKMISNQ